MPSAPDRLAALKQQLRRFEHTGKQSSAVFSTGLEAIDRVLPNGGLQQGALHEITAAPADRAAAVGFLALLLAAIDGPAKPILWCLDTAELYGPGLARAGLAPERLVLARGRRPQDRLWSMEEGLRVAGLAAVIGEVAQLDLTASRRLQLAAEESGVPCFALRPADNGTLAGNAAVTRWAVSAVPGLRPGQTGLNDFGPLRGRWQIRLLRCRGAAPAEDDASFGTWLVTEPAPGHAAEAISMPIAESRLVSELSPAAAV